MVRSQCSQILRVNTLYSVLTVKGVIHKLQQTTLSFLWQFPVFRGNKTWYFMWTICLADDSHEMSSLIFHWKITKLIVGCRLLHLHSTSKVNDTCTIRLTVREWSATGLTNYYILYNWLYTNLVVTQNHPGTASSVLYKRALIRQLLKRFGLRRQYEISAHLNIKMKLRISVFLVVVLGMVA